MDKPPPKHKYSDFFYNGLTYSGIILALLVFFIEILLFGIDFFSESHSVYLGIITYAILPPFLILGLLLIPIGAMRRRRHVLKGLKSARRMPIYVNFHNPQHRRAFLIFTVGTVIFIIMSVIGSYQAYHYTESVQFCGIACHDVMEPQYRRYLQSAHARVKCVECHIGGGVEPYLSSKMNGARQVLSLAKNDYPKPITGPLDNLRPAEEICERCHWPSKSYGSWEIQREYFFSGERDYKSWFLRMLIPLGGPDKNDNGIHRHMYMDRDIYYIADDEARQKISWIKSVDKNGKETVYTADDSAYKGSEPPAELVRKMDCMDCHNRPAHQFWPPYKLVNEALRTGMVDSDLPGIKGIAVDVLSAKYGNKEEAAHSIEQTLISRYQKQFGRSYGQHKHKIDEAIKHIVSIYENHYFPKMNASWVDYPDNIGHINSQGCFRCHDGEHVSSGGKPITRDCTACHTIIEQGPTGFVEKSTDGLPFRHPVDIGEAWKDLSCFDCHAGY